VQEANEKKVRFFSTFMFAKTKKKTKGCTLEDRNRESRGERNKKKVAGFHRALPPLWNLKKKISKER